MQEQLKKASEALLNVLKYKKDIYDAFYRLEIGSISLIYGYPGDATKGFKKGYGISHIVAKRD